MPQLQYGVFCFVWGINDPPAFAPWLPLLLRYVHRLLIGTGSVRMTSSMAEYKHVKSPE
jgi:hypothetical protein